jgi:STE24 endopeptidase
VFNRFEPLPDDGLAAELRDLSSRAGAPVGEVLVADASRRTRRLNAYVSGFGRTRRIVLGDTLLRESDGGVVAVVAAHELAHARERHVLKRTVLAAGQSALSVLVLWALLRSTAALGAIGAGGAGDPRVVPFALLVGAGLNFLIAPFFAVLSRRFERVADRASLDLTADRASYVRLHVELARANLVDLDPPRLFHALFASHPTPRERLAAAG